MRTLNAPLIIVLFIFDFSMGDGVVLEIYLDHKFQWPQEDLNCESSATNEIKNIEKTVEFIFKVQI